MHTRAGIQTRMAAAQPLARPVQTLREAITNLEAAITLTIADPKPRPVHRLRTSTRRIEASLTLLELLPGLPEHGKAARKAAKLLKKLRRAAGVVRDLDVQHDLVSQLENQPQTSQATSPESAQETQPATSQKTPVRHLQRDARSLRKTLKHLRNRRAEDLRDTLAKLQSSLAPALEHLLEVLAPADSLTVTAARLTALTRDWYQHHTPAPGDALNTGDPDLLHAIRKSAKVARYIAESVPADQDLRNSPDAAAAPARTRSRSAKSPVGSSSKATGLAAAFEVLQQTGGSWHDLHDLAAIARDHLGKRSPVTRHFEVACQTALELYERRLEHPPA